MIVRKGTVHVALLAVACATALSCGGGGGGGTASNSAPSTTPVSTISVSVSPPSATLAPGGSQQFTATVSGTTNTAVTWSAGNIQGGNTSVGTISSAGVYTAPTTVPNPSAVNILAVSVADSTKSASATANIQVHHDNQDFQNSPIKLGTTGGNATDSVTTGNRIACCSGTLGALVSRGGNFFILSNNHVLDKSDHGANGDPISHPGLAESNCGQLQNKIVANLSQAAPLNSTSNVDAAMAQIVAGQVDTTGSILDLAALGQPAAPSATIAPATIGEGVAKSGDATGLTCSKIDSVSLDVSVTYSTQCQGGSTFNVVYRRQVSVQGSAFSNSGDSGSLIVTSDTARPVALLYAGSSTGTVGHPIQDVLSALSSNGVQPQIVGGADHSITCPLAGQTQSTALQRAATTVRLDDAEVARATAVKNLHEIELMQDPAVLDVGIGQSEDNPSEAAVTVFLKEHPRLPIPAQIEGVRTKVISASAFQGQAQQSNASLLPISGAQLAEARVAKERHVDDMMSNQAILGVGVGASYDNPTESAVVVFVEQGKHVVVPAQIDGVRTRVIVTDRFRNYGWGTRTINACSRR